MAVTASADEDPPDDGWSDEQFLEMALDGSQGKAFELLFANLDRLRAYLDARFSTELGGSRGIEGIVNDAAWKAVESAGSYRPERGGILVFAFVIGVNLARDRIRSDQARHARERAVAREGSVRTREMDDVLEAVRSLPDPYRTILLFDLEHGGRGPAEELAALLGVAVQTIYNWRRQAHILLMRLLE